MKKKTAIKKPSIETIRKAVDISQAIEGYKRPDRELLYRVKQIKKRFHVEISVSK